MLPKRICVFSSFIFDNEEVALPKVWRKYFYKITHETLGRQVIVYLYTWGLRETKADFIFYFCYYINEYIEIPRNYEPIVHVLILRTLFCIHTKVVVGLNVNNVWKISIHLISLMFGLPQKTTL